MTLWLTALGSAKLKLRFSFDAKAQKDICALEGFISVQRLRYFSPEVMTDKHVLLV